MLLQDTAAPQSSFCELSVAQLAAVVAGYPQKWQKFRGTGTGVQPRC